MGQVFNVDLDFGGVVVGRGGTITIKEGVPLDEASRIVWEGVRTMMGMSTPIGNIKPQDRTEAIAGYFDQLGYDVSDRNVVDVLKELAGCFDCGCSIHMGEDDITVEGFDYHPDCPTEGPKAGSIIIARNYSADYKYKEAVCSKGEARMVDTLTPLIEKIKAERSPSLPQHLRPGSRVQKSNEALGVGTRRRRGKVLSEPFNIGSQSWTAVQWDGDFTPDLFRTELLEQETE